MTSYLAPSEFVDSAHPAVVAHAERADDRASAVASAESASCVPKAILLTAGVCALGIPGRPAFSHVTAAYPASPP